jgi:dihydroxyacetone kinase phosphotransfer subunit
VSVSLVIVSHSRRLAEGLAELVEQVVQGRVRVAFSGGAEDGRLGTSAADIRRALDEVDAPDGVLVLMDLGSAVMSAEVALEELPQERRRRTRLVDAPVVEGAVAAGVEASLGSDLDAVVRVAEQARTLPKLGG